MDGTQTVTITAASAGFVDGSSSVDVTDDDVATLTLSIDLASMSENGGTATGTVTRNTGSSGDLVVTLSSNDASEATVPATVTIPDGQTSATFTITAVDDAVVDGTQTVTITAASGVFVDGTDTIDVTDDDVATLTLSIDLASMSENGGTATGTVTRNTGSSGDLVVTLSSNDTSEATVPATVTIPDGQTSATFTITAVDDAVVDGTQTVTITAASGVFVDGTDTIDVTDDDVATLTLSIDLASMSENGGTATGTVTRNTGSSGDLVVTLSSNDTSEATVPATVTILDGQTSATFTITAVDDAVVDGTQAVTITAASGVFVDGTDTIDVTDDDVATLTLSIDLASMSENGGTATGTVTRNTGATGDLVVNLSSNDTGEATVPVTVTILDGQTSATFTITAVDDAVVDGTQTVTITAAAGVFVDGTDTIDVTDDETPTLTLSIDLASMSENGGTATGTVTRNTGSTGDLVVTLSSNDTSEATVPATVTILDGQTSATFTITAVDDAVVDGTQTVSITAAAATFADGTDSIDVTDDEVATLTLTFDSISISENGGIATGTVTRNTGTSGALVVSLFVDDGSEATVPVSVSIPDGSASATFSVTGLNDSIVDGTQVVTVRAEAAGLVAAEATLDVTDVDSAKVSIAGIQNAHELGPQNGRFMVSLSRAAEQDVVVSYTVNGTATSGVDFTVLSGQVTISGGQLSALIDVQVIDDFFAEITETVNLTLGTVTAVGDVSLEETQESAGILLLNDDLNAIDVSPATVTVSENGTTATFSVRLKAQPTANVVVQVNSSDVGEAAVSTATLTFTPANWNVAQTVTVTGIDDAVVDGAQNTDIVLTVDGPSSAVEFRNAPAAIVNVITEDNDAAGTARLDDITFYNVDAVLEDGLSPDRTGQRSIIRHVQVVLDGLVTIPTGPVTDGTFVVTNTTLGTTIGLTVTSSSQVGNRTIVVLSFTSGTDPLAVGSLADGRYRLDIDGGSLFDADNSGTVGGLRSVQFHRFYGDADGDGDVDNGDYGRLLQAASGNVAFRSAFDRDDDNDLFDELLGFKAHYGKRI
ncbi:MAG: Calx-beta domain-containing protein [Planctomycetaceae bacterium]